MYGWTPCNGEWFYVKNGQSTNVPGTYTGNRGEWSPPIHLLITVDENKITVYNRGAKVNSFVDTEYQMGYILLQLYSNSVVDNFEVRVLDKP
jgi:hypothetical protein